MVPYKINEATFTFKENLQDDNKGRKLLGMWLEMAKHRFNLHNYIWKAEPQERGAIHFHMVTGQYLPYKEVCYTWNRLLYKHGLKQVNANSTDVHAVHSVNSVEAYLTEYLMNENKHEGRRMITGKLWGCNHALSQAGKMSLHLTDQDRDALSRDWNSYHLANKIQGKFPEFLNFTDVYCLPDDFWNTVSWLELKQCYAEELELLKPPKRDPEFWPRK